MLFALHCFDQSDSVAIRQENYPAHRAHLVEAEKFGVRLVMTGPLVADDGTSPVGSLLVIDAPSRIEAEKFLRADPFYQAGLWQKMTVTAFKKVNG